jgi:hypothetical protein
MKKPLFYFVLLSSIYINAQTTIVDEKIVDGNVPLDYRYLPKSNKFIIEKGKQPEKISFFNPTLGINTIISYDIFGKKEIIAENVEWMWFDFSVTENTFKGTNLSKSPLSRKTYKYFSKGKATSSSDFTEPKNVYIEVSGHQCFNDKYELGFTDEKSKTDINLKKDQLFLKVTDIFTSKEKILNIEKPDINRLLGDAFIKPEEDLGFATNIIDNERFEIITKSISKDYKTTILYRTNYNIEGKKLDETSFTVHLNDYFLIYSNNGGGFTKEKMGGTGSIGQTASVFADDLSINNFFQDNTTEDVYLYGLFGSKAKGLNEYNSPSGYYIFKFDKKGNKIWESINVIEDKKDFNDKIFMLKLSSDLRFYNDKLYFSTGEDNNKEYLHYSFLDKKTGKILSQNKISYEKAMISFTGKIGKKGFENMFLGIESLIAIDSNKKVEEYVKSINPKNKLFFKTVFSGHYPIKCVS